MKNIEKIARVVLGNIAACNYGRLGDRMIKRWIEDGKEAGLQWHTPSPKAETYVRGEIEAIYDKGVHDALGPIIEAIDANDNGSRNKAVSRVLNNVCEAVRALKHKQDAA